MSPAGPPEQSLLSPPTALSGWASPPPAPAWVTEVSTFSLSSSESSDGLRLAEGISPGVPPETSFNTSVDAAGGISSIGEKKRLKEQLNVSSDEPRRDARVLLHGAVYLAFHQMNIDLRKTTPYLQTKHFFFFQFKGYKIKDNEPKHFCYITHTTVKPSRIHSRATTVDSSPNAAVGESWHRRSMHMEIFNDMQESLNLLYRTDFWATDASIQNKSLYSMPNEQTNKQKTKQNTCTKKQVGI